ncbi:hypothetical protein E2562_027200 [Oryza meyeriana var. granulata]|uniref:Uncharacterized protein n=1 Tax=Oryza meyeriana var. granulata TaxID=110450 RepID=A0A6G1EZM6_9ORYZ|nr:hypothetical protein E2562_027200 [Oryza meyeriana var. granulata]
MSRARGSTPGGGTESVRWRGRRGAWGGVEGRWRGDFRPDDGEAARRPRADSPLEQAGGGLRRGRRRGRASTSARLVFGAAGRRPASCGEGLELGVRVCGWRRDGGSEIWRGQGCANDFTRRSAG